MEKPAYRIETATAISHYVTLAGIALLIVLVLLPFFATRGLVQNLIFVFYMLALALAQAVIALRGHAMVAVGWVSAVATFLLVTAVASDDLYLRVEAGLVAASTVALAIFWATLRSRMARGVRPDAEAFIDGIADSPVEP